MTRAIGIDIGTFGCRMAAIDGDAPKILDGPDGTPVTPTTVALDTRLLVGGAAEEKAVALPSDTITGFLRLLGRKFHSPEVDWLRTCCPYTVVAAPNGDAHIYIDNRGYSPQELLSHVLQRMREEAEKQLDAKVSSAVLAVPSCFDHLQRKAVLDAAKLAGIEGGSLVNNTAAAAVAHAAGRMSIRRTAIIDFGAGTMDVGLFDLNGSEVETLAVAGHQMLGGDDIDRRLILHFVDTFEEATGVDATNDPGALVRFRQRALAAKQELSQRTKSKAIAVDGVMEHEGKKLRFAHGGVSRRKLVELIAEELASVKEPCFWVFEDAGLGTDDIEEVVAIGGVTRMPAVLSAIKYLFRNKPKRPDNADQLVAMGAARVAASRAGEWGKVRCKDLISISTGIKVRHGKLLTVVSRNTGLPCREVRMFQTTGGRQKAAVFELYQGENELATENAYLGRFSIEELPSEGKFPVAFHVDESAMLNVMRVDPRTGNEETVPINLAGGLTETDMKSLREQREARTLPTMPPPDRRPSSETPIVTVKTATGHKLDKADLEESPSRIFRRARPGTYSDAPTIARPAPPAPKEERGPIEVGADSLVGTTLGDRYEIESIVADGGMGRVYRARHKLLKKRFAIKVLHPELATSRDIAERFVREAQAASSIQSDHVVDISDFGLLEDGTGYFVMEYLNGNTLEEIIDNRGPLPSAMVRSVGIQIADGLRGAHEEQIVHRDLKPANVVLMERQDHPFFCKILDFGIAKNPTSDSSGLITRVGVMMGTPHYMAPEQIDGHVDARSDIYALGLLLFEMATAQPPFDAESVAELLAKQKWEEPPRIHDVCPTADCSEDLEAVIRKCLEKEAEKRYQSAKEAAEALQKVSG
jgi:molecular chaperone DnaK